MSFITSYDHMDVIENFGVHTGIASWPEYAERGTNAWGAWDDARRERYNKWQEAQLAANPVVFPKGTIIVFDRYHVSHSGTEAITVRVLGSPEPRLVTKKNGGKGKGKMRVYFRVHELNTLPELEATEEPS